MAGELLEQARAAHTLEEKKQVIRRAQKLVHNRLEEVVKSMEKFYCRVLDLSGHLHGCYGLDALWEKMEALKKQCFADVTRSESEHKRMRGAVRARLSTLKCGRGLAEDFLETARKDFDDVMRMMEGSYEDVEGFIEERVEEEFAVWMDVVAHEL